MNAFAPAIDAMFLDPIMAEDAEYVSRGFHPPVTIRIIRRMPDGLTDFGTSRLVQPAVVCDVRVSDVPTPAKTDQLTFGGVTYEVQAAPMRDREGLVWSLDLRPC